MKNQVSVFIIFGILIVVILGINHTIKIKKNSLLSENFFSQEEINVQIENIQSNIIWCLYDSSEASLRSLGF